MDGRLGKYGVYIFSRGQLECWRNKCVYHSREICTRVQIVSLLFQIKKVKYIGSWWGNREEGDHWGDLGMDGWIILGRICGMWVYGLDWVGPG